MGQKFPEGEGRSFQVNYLAFGQERKGSSSFFGATVSFQVNHRVFLINSPRKKPGIEGGESVKKGMYKAKYNHSSDLPLGHRRSFSTWVAGQIARIWHHLSGHVCSLLPQTPGSGWSSG